MGSEMCIRDSSGRFRRGGGTGFNSDFWGLRGGSVRRRGGGFRGDTRCFGGNGWASRDSRLRFRIAGFAPQHVAACHHGAQYPRSHQQLLGFAAFGRGLGWSARERRESFHSLILKRRRVFLSDRPRPLLQIRDQIGVAGLYNHQPRFNPRFLTLTFDITPLKAYSHGC